MRSDTMHHARSRQGCLTCRSKKVKCDEQTPKCRRCHRLELKCDWAKPNGRLRPTGKSKSRARPDYPKILPRNISKAADLRHEQHETPNPWHWPIVISPPDPEQATRFNEILIGDTINDFSVSAFHTPASAPAWGDWGHELELFGNTLHTGQPAGFEDSGKSSSTVLGCSSLGLGRDSQSATQVQWPLQSETVLSIPNLGVSWQNMVLSQEFLHTGREGDALQYYTSLYPTMTISKTVRWSSYMIVLRYSSQEPMAMHLLIAASLIDLATSQDGIVDISSAAHTHAKAGMALLKAAMAPEANHDPVSVIIAAFFLYRYMAVAQGHDPEAITEWSKAVSNYVKEKRLDDLCAGRNPTATLALSRREEASPAMTHEKKTHMARLMLWTFYEDIFASIKGYGGALARHFVEKPERSREIYQYSCAELESVWGADYPEREILDDVENAPIISFLYEVITLYAEVNRAVSSPLDLPAAKSAVEEKIDKLEARSRSLIRLTTMNVQPRSRVMINADYMVPLFYALRIYCFRSFLSDDSLATPSPPAVQSSVSSILQLAQRSLSRGPLDPMQARFQWPLFMAGIETTDRIHKEWAHSKLRTASMSIAFQTIVCLEEETQRRTPMPLVRQLMDTKNSAIPM